MGHSHLDLDLSLGGAFLLGALHTLEPAHGRGLAAAYLVGARGRVYEVLGLGGVVTVTHIAVALLLALAAGLLAGKGGEAFLNPAVRAFGAVIVLLLGISMLRNALRPGASCCHGVDHHSHGGGAGEPQAGLSRRQVLLLGFSGGLVPCQGSTSMIALAAATGHLRDAIWLILAFGLGLGSALVVTGMAILRAHRLARKAHLPPWWDRAVLIASAVLVLVMGLASLVYVGRGMD